MTDLTLPGTIPGLLRRCSPVVRADGSRFVLEYGDEAYIRGARHPSLDLTDATGRTHASWWWRLAYLKDRDLPAEHWTRTAPDFGGGYGFLGFSRFDDYRATLADLDPDDPRTLPDGSRWVDAEALRRVVLHVAEVTP